VPTRSTPRAAPPVILLLETERPHLLVERAGRDSRVLRGLADASLEASQVLGEVRALEPVHELATCVP